MSEDERGTFMTGKWTKRAADLQPPPNPFRRHVHTRSDPRTGVSAQCTRTTIQAGGARGQCAAAAECEVAAYKRVSVREMLKAQDETTQSRAAVPWRGSSVQGVVGTAALICETSASAASSAVVEGNINVVEEMCGQVPSNARQVPELCEADPGSQSQSLQAAELHRLAVLTELGERRSGVRSYYPYRKRRRAAHAWSRVDGRAVNEPGPYGNGPERGVVYPNTPPPGRVRESENT
ncbi:hypothetical protein K438DRAFT_1762045 [Mycena galopus ATCC 62051]|nr:hypothetical protein K438DRAFT_1762045 [Mycena galopus ATCC 62051]